MESTDADADVPELLKTLCGDPERSVNCDSRRENESEASSPLPVREDPLRPEPDQVSESVSERAGSPVKPKTSRHRGLNVPSTKGRRRLLAEGWAVAAPSLHPARVGDQKEVALSSLHRHQRRRQGGGESEVMEIFGCFSLQFSLDNNNLLSPLQLSLGGEKEKWAHVPPGVEKHLAFALGEGSHFHPVTVTVSSDGPLVKNAENCILGEIYSSDLANLCQGGGLAPPWGFTGWSPRLGEGG